MSTAGIKIRVSTSSGGAMGEINTASNIGAGIGLFAQKNVTDLEFKSLVAGTNISLSSGTDTVTISSSASGEANTASNLGAGEGIFSSKSGVDLRLKSIVAGSGVNLSSDTNTITITNSSIGEANTASNLGASGSSVFSQKSGVDLQFRKLIGGTNVTLTENTNDITIDASGAAGETNTASNVGAGTGVFAQKSGVDLEFKSLVSGSGINVTSDATTVTVTNSGIGEANTASNLGAGEGIFESKSSLDLRFKSLVEGTNVSLSSDTNTVTINASGTGEVNTASNLGASGGSIFAQKSGVDLEFRKIIGGNSITVTQNTNDITIDGSITDNEEAAAATVTIDTDSGLDSHVTGTLVATMTINLTNLSVGRKGMISFEGPNGETVNFQQGGSATNVFVGSTGAATATLGTANTTTFQYAYKRINSTTVYLLITQLEF